jgi:hypothetical protein
MILVLPKISWSASPRAHDEDLASMRLVSGTKSTGTFRHENAGREWIESGRLKQLRREVWSRLTRDDNVYLSTL